MQAYHWLPSDVDEQPLDLLLDIIVLQDKLDNYEVTSPVDAYF